MMRSFLMPAVASALALAACTAEQNAALEGARMTIGENLRQQADIEARTIRDLQCRPRVGALVRTSTPEEVIDTLARCGLPPESLAAALGRRGVVLTIDPG